MKLLWWGIVCALVSWRDVQHALLHLHIVSMRRQALPLVGLMVRYGSGALGLVELRRLGLGRGLLQALLRRWMVAFFYPVDELHLLPQCFTLRR